jgi:hypothetical protein
MQSLPHIDNVRLDTTLEGLVSVALGTSVARTCFEGTIPLTLKHVGQILMQVSNTFCQNIWLYSGPRGIAEHTNFSPTDDLIKTWKDHKRLRPTDLYIRSLDFKDFERTFNRQKEQTIERPPTPTNLFEDFLDSFIESPALPQKKSIQDGPVSAIYKALNETSCSIDSTSCTKTGLFEQPSCSNVKPKMLKQPPCSAVKPKILDQPSCSVQHAMSSGVVGEPLRKKPKKTKKRVLTTDSSSSCDDTKMPKLSCSSVQPAMSSRIVGEPLPKKSKKSKKRVLSDSSSSCDDSNSRCSSGSEPEPEPLEPLEKIHKKTPTPLEEIQQELDKIDTLIPGFQIDTTYIRYMEVMLSHLRTFKASMNKGLHPSCTHSCLIHCGAAQAKLVNKPKGRPLGSLKKKKTPPNLNLP